jgi:branched-subunit amino acid ABC-type transport system permease component
VDQLLQFLIAGLKNGSIYALVALGFTIVYAATGAINFAQGEFFMLGGMLWVSVTELAPPPSVPCSNCSPSVLSPATTLFGSSWSLSGAPSSCGS